MPVNSQVRIPLNKAMQQSNASPVAALVSQQFPNGGNPFLTNFQLLVDYDRFVADATGGNIIATVPSAADLVKGKPYIVEKKGGTNTVTVTFTDPDTFFGEATVVLTGDGDTFAFISDGEAIKSAFPSGTPGVAPAGSLAADENLADLDDADAAITNLGGTVTGAALFKAATPLAARTTLGTNEVHLPVRLSLVGTDADEIRLQSPVAGAISAVYSDQSKGPIATGAATTTLTVGGAAPVANTLTHSIAEAAGTKKTMSPTGPNAVVAVGTEIRLAITGTNDAAGSAAGYTIVITRT